MASTSPGYGITIRVEGPPSAQPVAEVTAAIAAHNNATTSVHGITNTANLATSSSVTSAISTHNTTDNGHVIMG